MIRVRQINVSIDEDENELISKCAKKLKINKENIEEYKIVKKSIDARDKQNIVFCYEVDIKTKNEDEIFKNIKDMAELMKKCDICITAASTVLYECCAMLLPTIYVTVAKDQVYDADAFSENQMMIYCGNFQEEKDKVNKALSQMARDIINNKQLQQIMKNKMKIIKRNGAKNIATSLCGGNQ